MRFRQGLFSTMPKDSFATFLISFGGMLMINIIKSKRLYILSAIIIVFLLCAALQLTGKLQYTSSRLCTSVYVHLKHSDMGFKYKSFEYSPQFGNYSVFYTDSNGKIYAFNVAPNFLPIYVSYDPLNPDRIKDIPKAK